MCSSLLAFFTLALFFSMTSCSACTNKIQDVSDPVWNTAALYQIDAGTTCTFDAQFADIKVDYLSSDIQASYFQYKTANEVCTAVDGEKAYYSGMTLLTDYNIICAHTIQITNNGADAQKVMMFTTDGSFNIMASALIISLIVMIISL